MIERNSQAIIQAATEQVRDASREGRSDTEVQMAARRLVAAMEIAEVSKQILDKHGVDDIPLVKTVFTAPEPVGEVVAELDTPDLTHSAGLPSAAPSAEDSVDAEDTETEAVPIRFPIESLALKQGTRAYNTFAALLEGRIIAQELGERISDKTGREAANLASTTISAIKSLARDMGWVIVIHRGAPGRPAAYELIPSGKAARTPSRTTNASEANARPDAKPEEQLSKGEQLDKFTRLDRPIVLKAGPNEVLLVPSFPHRAGAKASVSFYTRVNGDWRKENFDAKKGGRTRVDIGNSQVIVSSVYADDKFEGFSVEDYQPKIKKTLAEVEQTEAQPTEVMPGQWRIAGLTSQIEVTFGAVNGQITRNGQYVFLRVGGQSYSLTEGKIFSVGHDSNRDVVISDDSVDGSHAAIIYTNGNILIRNYKSSLPGTVITPDTPPVLYNPLEHGPLPPLQGDIRNVFVLLGQGLEKPEIAERLHISESAVRSILELRGEYKVLGAPKSSMDALVKVLDAKLLRLRDITQGLTDEQFELLSDREKDVLEELDRDPARPNQEIADILAITENSLSAHITRMSKKFNKKKIGLLMDYRAYKQRKAN
jgi:DNA-binding CsgD family transcriptional regulator